MGHPIVCFFENGIEHRLSQSSGERVLLAWVVASDQPAIVVEGDDFSMGKFRFSAGRIKP